MNDLLASLSLEQLSEYMAYRSQEAELFAAAESLTRESQHKEMLAQVVMDYVGSLRLCDATRLKLISLLPSKNIEQPIVSGKLENVSSSIDEQLLDASKQTLEAERVSESATIVTPPALVSKRASRKIESKLVIATPAVIPLPVTNENEETGDSPSY